MSAVANRASSCPGEPFLLQLCVPATKNPQRCIAAAAANMKLEMQSMRITADDCMPPTGDPFPITKSNVPGMKMVCRRLRMHFFHFSILSNFFSPPRGWPKNLQLGSPSVPEMRIWSSLTRHHVPTRGLHSLHEFQAGSPILILGHRHSVHILAFWVWADAHVAQPPLCALNVAKPATSWLITAKTRLHPRL